MQDIEGKTVELFPSANPGAPLVVLNGEAGEGGAVHEAVRAATDTDFSLAAVSGLRWEDDLTPWPIPPIAKGQAPCAGKADAYIELLTGRILPKVLEALAARAGEYRAVFYMTYLYWLAARGLPMGLDHSILIPTLHDEPPVYIRYYDKVFAAAKGFAWLTPEEQAFGQKRFPCVREKPQVRIGAGVREPEGALPELPEQLRPELQLPEPELQQPCLRRIHGDDRYDGHCDGHYGGHHVHCDRAYLHDPGGCHCCLHYLQHYCYDHDDRCCDYFRDGHCCGQPYPER
jgi:hypothetical protein